MAAVLARGETVIDNAAREPEVVDLAESAHQNGRVDRRRRHVDHSREGRRTAARRRRTPIIPDRIEAGTFLVAGAITRGDLTVTGCAPEHLRALIAKLNQAARR